MRTFSIFPCCINFLSNRCKRLILGSFRRSSSAAAAMASKRMKKNAAAVPNSMTPKEPMSKEQKKVTDWLRKNVPTKKTKFLSAHVVEYFIGTKAVDALLNDSPWAAPKDAAPPSKNAPAAPAPGAPLVFTSREQIVSYMDDLLRHKQFHRAKKIPVVQESKKKSSKKEAKTDTSEVRRET